MKRLLSILIVVGVLGAAASFVLAPYVAFFAVRSAAKAEDVQGLADLVDYDAVRTSLRAQLAEGAGQAPPPSVLEDPIEAIRRTIERQAPLNVDAWLTPDALEGLTMGEGRAAKDRTPTPVSSEGATEGPMPEVLHWGVNRTRLGVSAEGSQEETVFTFERKGIFRWRLVHVGLPTADGAGPAEAAPAAGG